LSTTSTFVAEAAAATAATAAVAAEAADAIVTEEGASKEEVDVTTAEAVERTPVAAVERSDAATRTAESGTGLSTSNDIVQVGV